ncbi:hypothetical protein PM082_000962 [Marasmius tenuissimus]|nr:hypothetical protein PM082_000962 [Marasmius tenuissimus]
MFWLPRISPLNSLTALLPPQCHRSFASTLEEHASSLRFCSTRKGVGASLPKNSLVLLLAERVNLHLWTKPPRKMTLLPLPARLNVNFDRQVTLVHRASLSISPIINPFPAPFSGGNLLYNRSLHDGCRTKTMYRLSTTLGCLVVLASLVYRTFAHGGVLNYRFGNVWYNGFVPYTSAAGQSSIQREWDQYDPITNVVHPNLSCNINGAALSKQESATVAAGTTVTAYWNPWPHTIGPVLVYMAKCPGSCTSADSSALDWFKIDEAGLISGDIATGHWAMADLVANNNSWASIIPASLEPGEYMIRHELIAIHISNIPQFYPNCAQLIVTGTGNVVPAQTVKFPGGYAKSDPGLSINIFSQGNQTTYKIPGPPVFSG